MFNNKDIRKIVINKIGNPKIFVYLIIWLMFLVFFGTLAQRDFGLYQVQQDYFSSWIKWFGLLPTPSARLTMLCIFINLSCYFFRPGIWALKKIGITITHAGVILILVGSFLTAIFSVEGNMIIDEEEKSNYFENYYIKEFAIIDKTNPKYDEYIIFDEPMLKRDMVLESEKLPFKITVFDYLINCNPVQRIYFGNENFQGMAKNFYLQPLKPEKEFEQNRPGIIYEISGLNNPDLDGIYILFFGQSITQTLEFNNHKYEFMLRPYRTYLPFEIELLDFKKEMHPGTEVAKSFSSDVNLIVDGIPRKVIIKMNEPLRHLNYTFYQASFIEEGEKETTVLATVKNYGRLFPYISSIIMCIGILFHMIVMGMYRMKK